jgi:hypothetical protein
MRKSLLFTFVLLTAMIVACTTTGGGAAAEAGEPKVELVLKAEDAELVTDAQLQLEDANMNIGWWASTDDQAKWTLEVPEDGEYTVLARYSCTETQPGAVVKLTVGDQSIEYKVRSTSDWVSYTKREMGKMTLKAGSQPVVIQAVSIKAKYVMNLTDLIFQKF